MRSLRDHISETETAIERPQAGDEFDLDLAADCLIETYVADADEDSITVYVDEAAYATLERSGYLGETIRTYGPMGAGPGTGYAHTAARESAESCVECGYPMESCCCDQGTQEPKQQQDKAHWDFGRILELAGVADHKYDQEDDAYCEDQSADVLAQKELATDITNPMPGVHEAEYQGREVSLGKPFLTPDGPKKRAVYVKNPKGNVVKVNFGDKKLKIKKNIPARRKSFRARHHCENPGPRHRARYWSCKAW